MTTEDAKHTVFVIGVIFFFIIIFTSVVYEINKKESGFHIQEKK